MEIHASHILLSSSSHHIVEYKTRFKVFVILVDIFICLLQIRLRNMTVYFVWRNKLLITGSFQNLEMFPEIENTVLNPKSWTINLYNRPSFHVYFGTKKVAKLLLWGKI